MWVTVPCDLMTSLSVPRKKKKLTYKFHTGHSLDIYSPRVIGYLQLTRHWQSFWMRSSTFWGGRSPWRGGGWSCSLLLWERDLSSSDFFYEFASAKKPLLKGHTSECVFYRQLQRSRLSAMGFCTYRQKCEPCWKFITCFTASILKSKPKDEVYKCHCKSMALP